MARRQRGTCGHHKDYGVGADKPRRCGKQLSRSGRESAWGPDTDPAYPGGGAAQLGRCTHSWADAGEAVKCAICQQEVEGYWQECEVSDGQELHTSCIDGRLPERADVIAYLRAWPMRAGSGLAISIERGDHVGAAGKEKP